MNADIPRYSPNLRTDILNSTPKIETSATLGEQPGIGLYRQSYSVNKDVMDKLTDARCRCSRTSALHVQTKQGARS